MAALACSSVPAFAQFDQSPLPLTPFTSRFFGEHCGVILGNPNPCANDNAFGFGGSYIRATSVSANGIVVGLNGISNEDAPQRAIVWNPAFGSAAFNNGSVTLLGRPAFLNPVVKINDSANGIDASGTVIVGTAATNTDGGGIPEQLPVVWRFNAGVWGAPTVLTLLPGNTAGGANGISDNGNFATGHSGTFTNDSNVDLSQAVIWNLTGGGAGVVTSLGAAPDGWTRSAGNSVSNNGVVVGNYWDPGTANRPFVWAGGAMLPLDRLGNLGGNASAINSAGTRAVGNVRSGGFYEAVYWSTTNNWATHTATQLPIVQPSALPGNFAQNGARFGSYANAIDASGLVIVGGTDYACVGFGGFCSQATVWEIASSGTATGRTVAQALASAGVSTTNYALMSATGVRVVRNADGIATDIIIIGNGNRNFGVAGTDYQDIWLARLTGREAAPPTPAAPAAQAGVITLGAGMQSMQSLAPLANATMSDSLLGGYAQVGDYYRCARPLGAETSHWCAFTFGMASWSKAPAVLGSDSSNQELTGVVGLAHYFNSATSVGVSLGFSYYSGSLAFGGSFDSGAPTAGAYFSHRPDSGFQFFAAAVGTWFNQLDITRGYMNGDGLASSAGTTNGRSTGIMGRIGYAIPLAYGVTLTPFEQLSYASSWVSGWSEVGGPFAANINNIESSMTALRSGLAARQVLSDRLTIFGSLSWAHLLGRNTATVVGSLQLADCNSPAAITAFCNIGGPGVAQVSNWAEGNAGFRFQLDALSVFSASFTYANGSGYSNIISQIGYSRAL